MRTGFKGSAPVAKLAEEYKGTATEIVRKFMQSMDENENIDPVRAAVRIVEAVDGTWMSKGFEGKNKFRVPLGGEIATGIMEKVKELTENLEVFAEVCASVDFQE